MIRFDIVSIFPNMFSGVFAAGVIGRAAERGRIDVAVHDLRAYSDSPHGNVDDEVYGGGAGMLFRAEPMARAVAALREPGTSTAVVLMSPRGEVLTQALSRELADYERLLILCDRYEGCDERVRDLVTHEVSLGDYVLTGGEVAAMVLVDVVARLGPGVVGRRESVEADSFSTGLLDHGSYSRPAQWSGMDVPPVLLSGDHAAIRGFRFREGLRRTLESRPELLRGIPLGRDGESALAAERAGEG